MYRMVTALLIICYLTAAWFAKKQGVYIPGGAAVLMFPFGILIPRLFIDKKGSWESIAAGVLLCLLFQQPHGGYVGYMTGYLGNHICKCLEEQNPLPDKEHG